jgi:hypothetical protein
MKSRRPTSRGSVADFAGFEFVFAILPSLIYSPTYPRMRSSRTDPEISLQAPAGWQRRDM